jgi:hypothetical protein
LSMYNSNGCAIYLKNHPYQSYLSDII